MALKYKDKIAKIYKGDASPATLYWKNNRISGYKQHSLTGTDLLFNSTYKDAPFTNLQLTGAYTQGEPSVASPAVPSFVENASLFIGEQSVSVPRLRATPEYADTWDVLTDTLTINVFERTYDGSEGNWIILNWGGIGLDAYAQVGVSAGNTGHLGNPSDIYVGGGLCDKIKPSVSLADWGYPVGAAREELRVWLGAAGRIYLRFPREVLGFETQPEKNAEDAAEIVARAKAWLADNPITVWWAKAPAISSITPRTVVSQYPQTRIYTMNSPVYPTIQAQTIITEED